MAMIRLCFSLFSICSFAVGQYSVVQNGHYHEIRQNGQLPDLQNPVLGTYMYPAHSYRRPFQILPPHNRHKLDSSRHSRFSTKARSAHVARNTGSAAERPKYGMLLIYPENWMSSTQMSKTRDRTQQTSRISSSQSSSMRNEAHPLDQPRERTRLFLSRYVARLGRPEALIRILKSPATRSALNNSPVQRIDSRIQNSPRREKLSRIYRHRQPFRTERRSHRTPLRSRNIEIIPLRRRVLRRKHLKPFSGDVNVAHLLLVSPSHKPLNLRRMFQSSNPQRAGQDIQRHDIQRSPHSARRLDSKSDSMMTSIKHIARLNSRSNSYLSMYPNQAIPISFLYSNTSKASSPWIPVKKEKSETNKQPITRAAVSSRSPLANQKVSIVPSLGINSRLPSASLRKGNLITNSIPRTGLGKDLTARVQNAGLGNKLNAGTSSAGLHHSLHSGNQNTGFRNRLEIGTQRINNAMTVPSESQWLGIGNNLANRPKGSFENSMSTFFNSRKPGRRNPLISFSQPSVSRPVLPLSAAFSTNINSNQPTANSRTSQSILIPGLAHFPQIGSNINHDIQMYPSGLSSKANPLNIAKSVNLGVQTVPGSVDLNKVITQHYVSNSVLQRNPLFAPRVGTMIKPNLLMPKGGVVSKASGGETEMITRDGRSAKLEGGQIKFE